MPIHPSVKFESPLLAGDSLRRLRRALLAWYDAHHRRLPWRAEHGRRPDPYHVLVSETMLQQTQVATVIPYFQRFLAAFPTVDDLARAKERQVLRLWQGLGYYRRARNLQAAARIIVNQHHGSVPRSVDELRQLPGVGPYTAGAVASIAFDLPVPIVDGNVARVFARLVALSKPIDTAATLRRLWALAGRLVPPRRAGDFNQALMELGSLVCAPRQPRCPGCPLRCQCRANAKGIVHRLPRRLPQRQALAVTHYVLALQRHGRYLFEQRSAQGLWARLWQMPTVEAGLPRQPAQQPRALPASWRSRFGLAAGSFSEVDRFIHRTSHRTIEFVVWTARASPQRIGKDGLHRVWRRFSDLDDLPLANPQRRAVALLRPAEPFAAPRSSC